jgi:hypothetical protein
MWMPALVGGAVAGVLAAIPLVNCFCCLWIIGGAMLSAHLLAKNSPAALTAGDGAIIGIFTGIIAAVVHSFVSLPFEAMNQQFVRKFMDQFSQFLEDMPAGWDSWINRTAQGGMSLAWFMLGLVISAVIYAIFGALGGIIGASLFGKKTLPPPPAGIQHETPQNPSDRQP